MKEKYDYIICGAGLSGLILASKIFDDRFFDDKNILLIDKDLNSSVNKTWCFWEKGNSMWKDYIVKSWDTVIFKSRGFHKEKSLNSYSYKMIKSKFFLDSIIKKIMQANNFDFYQERDNNGKLWLCFYFNVMNYNDAIIIQEYIDNV